MDLVTACHVCIDCRYSIPVAIPGVCILFFLNYTKRGYSDGHAWIQIWQGMGTETARRGYSDVLFLCLHLKKKTYTKRGYSNGQAWIQRRPGVDIAMA